MLTPITIPTKEFWTQHPLNMLAIGTLMGYSVIVV